MNARSFPLYIVFTAIIIQYLLLNAQETEIQWNTFMGGISADESKGVAHDNGNIYITGYSNSSWGNLIHAHAGDIPHSDAFVTELNNVEKGDNWLSLTDIAGP